MHQIKQPTPFRSGAQHTPYPVVTMRAKPEKPWLVLTAVLFGLFMALLDTAIVNIASQAYKPIPRRQSWYGFH